MAYIGQPVPSTVININQVKISDGKSVDVTVAASSGVNAGEFAVVDGFFGLALKTIKAEENTAGEMIALQIEQAEYITDQIDTSKTFTKGSVLYFDPTNKRFTDDSSVSGAILVGRITSAKDSNNVIQFVLYPQNAGAVTTSSSAPSVTVDNTLTQTGQAADAKKTGDELNKKVNAPTAGNGTSGQVLKTNGDGTTAWENLPQEKQQLSKIEDATGETDAHTQLNALLAELKAKGYMAQ